MGNLPIQNVFVLFKKDWKDNIQDISFFKVNDNQSRRGRAKNKKKKTFSLHLRPARISILLLHLQTILVFPAHFLLHRAVIARHFYVQLL